MGHRLAALAPEETAGSMPAARRSAAVSAVAVVLPAVPVIAIVGPAQRSRSRSPRQETRVPCARRRCVRGADVGCPDVEVGDLRRPRVGVEIGFGLNVDSEFAEGDCVLRGGSGACEAHHVPFLGEPPREGERVGVEPLDENCHPVIIAVSPTG